jgi:hypothetical protein
MKAGRGALAIALVLVPQLVKSQALNFVGKTCIGQYEQISGSTRGGPSKMDIKIVFFDPYQARVYLSAPGEVPLGGNASDRGDVEVWTTSAMSVTFAVNPPGNDPTSDPVSWDLHANGTLTGLSKRRTFRGTCKFREQLVL